MEYIFGRNICDLTMLRTRNYIDQIESEIVCTRLGFLDGFI